MILFLRERVPYELVRRAISLLAPGRDVDSMTGAEVIHLLGVTGVARLANVNRPIVLQAAGPESCSISDLIAPAAYGSFPDVGARYPSAAPMLQSSRGGYVDPPPMRPAGSASARPAASAAVAASVAPEYSADLFDDRGTPLYLAPAASMTELSRVLAVAPTELERVRASAPAEVAAAPVYAPIYSAPVSSGVRYVSSPTKTLEPAQYGTTYTAPAPGPAPLTLAPAQYGTTYSAPTRSRERSTSDRRNGSMMNMNGLYYSNPYYSNPSAPTAAQLAWNEAAEAGATDAELAILSGTFSPEPAAPAGSITGWPGAVPFRPDAWNFTTGVYILQQGDTFSGLASTYLQSPARYMEIWSLQPYRYTKAIDPSSVTPTRPLVRAGEPVIMPPEATARAKDLVRTGAPTAPAIGGPIGGAVGAPWSTNKKLAVGAGVLAGVAVIGGGIYYATK